MTIMTSMRQALLAVSFASLFCTSLTAQEAPGDASALQRIGEGNRDFAFESFAHIRCDKPNLAYSPLGVSAFYAMVYAGSRGQTAQELARVLNYPPSREKTLTSFGKLQKSLRTLPESEGLTLDVANSIWSSTALRPAFLKLIKSNLGAESHLIDGVSRTQRKMDDWVNLKTRGLIEECPVNLTRYTDFVLMNAVYFKADWANAFTPEYTLDTDFHLSNGDVVQVPMMNQSAFYQYGETEELQIISLPYQDDRFSMLVVLPDEDVSIDDLEASLTPEAVGRWSESLEHQRVRLSLPRFEIRSSIDLNDMLQSMGMPGEVFLAPDIAGITPKGDVEIGSSIQEVVLIVDEKGTEAAAVTAVVFGASGRLTRTAAFTADRPFLFLLRDQVDGTILFMGRVKDPRKTT